MSSGDFNSADGRPIFLQGQPLGNGAGLGNFHTVNPEYAEPSNTSKIVGVLAVALMVGVAGVALYARSTSPSQPQPVAAASDLTAPPTAPVPQATVTPNAIMPASAPAARPLSAQADKAAKAEPDSLRAAQVRTSAWAKTAARSQVASGSDAASARLAANSNPTSQPPQRAVIAQPVSPPSAVATTNTQSDVALPQGAATASDIPATPRLPVQDQQNAAPAPAQPPAQSAGQINQYRSCCESCRARLIAVARSFFELMPLTILAALRWSRRPKLTGKVKNAIGDAKSMVGDMVGKSIN